jgi:hypothetical protein
MAPIAEQHSPEQQHSSMSQQLSSAEVVNSVSISGGGHSDIDEARCGLKSGNGLGTGWLITIVKEEGWVIPRDIVRDCIEVLSRLLDL